MNQNTIIAIILAIIIVVFGAIYLWPSETSENGEEIVEQIAEELKDNSLQELTVSEAPPEAMPENKFNIQVLKEGEGNSAKAGDVLEVHYVGTLADGTKFDSSRDRGQPFTLTLGAGQVIKGWEQGLIGIKVGEIRKLTIPPELGYGSKDLGTIPPNSTLIFEVELLKIN